MWCPLIFSACLCPASLPAPEPAEWSSDVQPSRGRNGGGGDDEAQRSHALTAHAGAAGGPHDGDRLRDGP